MREEFSVLEQITTLFRGDKILEVFRDLKNEEKCETALENSDLIPSPTDKHTFEDFILNVRSHMLKLLVQFQRQMDHEILNYANIICTACNPKENKFF